MEDYTGWLTMTQIAKRLRNKYGKQASRAWAHKLRERGEFPSACFVLGLWVVDPADLASYIERKARKDKALNWTIPT